MPLQTPFEGIQIGVAAKRISYYVFSDNAFVFTTFSRAIF